MLSRINQWFSQHDWKPFAFQQRVWQGMQAGRWGLLSASTGSGKTLATWFGALLWCERQEQLQTGNLKILWVTPMRALAKDTADTLAACAAEVMPHWCVQMRTGDTGAAVRARQAKRLPEVLITTPESLCLLLADSQAHNKLRSVQAVIVDEWHELLGSKRGVQLQLAIARLSVWQPDLICWGMSATLGNLDQAQQTLVWPSGKDGLFVSDDHPKQIDIQVLLPETVERFAWAGHLGLSMAPQVAALLWQVQSSLVFVNTRSQAERWYQALLEADPQLAGVLALHHGSLDQSVRQWVEAGLKQGELRAVVCTSGLDLGVDFQPVEQVLQIGSAKGVARLMQRAGRAGHAPGKPARLTLVPTYSLEILEAVAACDAVAQSRLEFRLSPQAPMDVLVQHLVTIGLGGGFEPDALFDEVRCAYAYRDLTREQWSWALEFVSGGGRALAAYPDYHRVQPDDQGIWRVSNRQFARRHRMSIGTIVSDAMMQVRFWRRGGGGGGLGQVEESFVARLKPGDRFHFAGRSLELVRVQDMTAYVRKSEGAAMVMPRWLGGNMALSSELAGAMLDRLDRRVSDAHPAWVALKPLLELQSAWSALPSAKHLLIEQMSSREGMHLYFYPLAGRQVHLGLASLLAWRMAQLEPRTFAIAVNDYGFELLCPQPFDARQCVSQNIFSTDSLEQDIVSSLNAGELSQRRFREIARIAGLVFQGYPGAHKSTKQVQASSALFYDVFEQYDPANQLLLQARNETLRDEFEHDRLRQTLTRLSQMPIQWHELERPTPFAFPLLVQRLRERLSSEKLSERVARMVRELQRACDDA